MYTAFSGKVTDYFKELYEEAFGGGLTSAVNDSLNPEKVNFFGLEVNPALYTAIIVSVALIIFAVLVRIFAVPRFKKEPKGLQLLLEGLVSYFDKSSHESLHNHAGFVAPYVFTAAIFIALSTLAELLGLRPALSSINACFALGITSFFVIHYSGFRQKKARRLLFYINPINWITSLSVPLSLSLRLFGSIVSGFIIMELLYSMIFTSIAVPAAISVITTFFHAFLQAFLFATLTIIFTSEAVE